MSGPLARAILVPYQRDEKTKKRDYKDEIWLDFNPETLKIKYPASAETSGSQGCSAVQTRSKAPAVLSFAALFDSTRPEALGRGGLGLSASVSLGGGGPDVREKTKLLKALLGRDPERGANAGYQFVQFRWGAILFNGLLDDFTETLELFTSDGTPLRARMDIKIKEDGDEKEETPAGRVSWSKRKSIGSIPNLGLSPGLSLGLGAGMNLGFSAGAGIGLSAGASVGVFGGAALSAVFGAGVDLSLSVSGLPRASGGAAALGSTPTPWAPAGPAAGSTASADATAVVTARAEGRSAADPSDALAVATRAETGAKNTDVTGMLLDASATISSAKRHIDPLPIAGSPPRRHPPVAGATPSPVYSAPAPCAAPPGRPTGRPSWERPSVEVASSTGGRKGRW